MSSSRWRMLVSLSSAPTTPHTHPPPLSQVQRQMGGVEAPHLTPLGFTSRTGRGDLSPSARSGRYSLLTRRNTRRKPLGTSPTKGPLGAERGGSRWSLTVDTSSVPFSEYSSESSGGSQSSPPRGKLMAFAEVSGKGIRSQGTHEAERSAKTPKCARAEVASPASATTARARRQ